MADWVLEVVQILLKMAKTNPQLVKDIYLAIKKIEKFPAQTGDFVSGTRYNYTDPEGRFRIGYNFHPDASELEIVLLHIFS